MKYPGSIDAVGKSTARGVGINWAQAYQRRMRRFNLEIILFALVSLTILITWLFMGLSAFFQ